MHYILFVSKPGSPSAACRGPSARTTPRCPPTRTARSCDPGSGGTRPGGSRQRAGAGAVVVAAVAEGEQERTNLFSLMCFQFFDAPPLSHLEGLVVLTFVLKDTVWFTEQCRFPLCYKLFPTHFSRKFSNLYIYLSIYLKGYLFRNIFIQPAPEPEMGK